MWGQIVFEHDFSLLRAKMQETHDARELALSESRKLIQLASKSIKLIHRRSFNEANEVLQELQNKLERAKLQIKDWPQILYGGHLQDAEKEFVEARTLLAMTQQQVIPTAAELNVSLNSYLHGVAEAASELRRLILDEVRKGEFDSAEAHLNLMEEVYEGLTTFDFPDGLTGGLRRTLDALRAVLERTRSDLTLTFSQYELVTELRKRKF